MFNSKYYKIKQFFVKVFFPDDCNCLVCNEEIPSGSAFPLCEECAKDFPFNNGNVCLRCGSPIENEACFCLECQNHNKNFDIARSALKYEGVVKKLILDMKFHNNRWIEKYFANLLAEVYIKNNMNADIIVPVPISNKRQKERGYNQSELIAEHLSQKLHLPLVNDAVIKIKDNDRQMGLTIAKRRENVKGVYKPQNREIVKGKKVLLVDDILTTGSTLSEVARQLKIAGASVVYGLVVASPQYKPPSEEYSEQELAQYEVYKS